MAATPRRLDPCPCGSGKRYRDCHGALSTPVAGLVAPPPGYAEAAALRAQGRADEAGRLLDERLAAGDEPTLRNLRGLVRMDLMRLDDALADFEAVIARDPSHVDAHYNRGLVRLLRGDYERGWADYAWRTRAPGYADYANFPFGMPRWKGEALAGKRLLVHAEQGLGDTIQFARFIRPLAAQGATIDVFCHPPLAALMGRVPGVRKAMSDLVERPTHDFHATIMDVGIAQVPRADSAHWFGPYIAPLPERVAKYAGLLSRRSGPRIGIAWKGSPRHANDRNRSMAREIATRLLRGTATFVDLQVGEPPLAASMIAPAPPIADWDDTAALIAGLDLVVSVDTAVAHLAGAMGKPVIVMLPFSPDWRWREAAGTTPWYPTMHLVRQGADRDWDVVIERVVARYPA